MTAQPETTTKALAEAIRSSGVRRRLAERLRKHANDLDTAAEAIESQYGIRDIPAGEIDRE